MNVVDPGFRPVATYAQDAVICAFDVDEVKYSALVSSAAIVLAPLAANDIKLRALAVELNIVDVMTTRASPLLPIVTVDDGPTVARSV